MVSKEHVCPECAEDFWCDADYLNHMNREHGHDGSWCNCCDEPHDENHCSVALVREVRRNE